MNEVYRKSIGVNFANFIVKITVCFEYHVNDSLFLFHGYRDSTIGSG
jgi:hypothetical protein